MNEEKAVLLAIDSIYPPRIFHHEKTIEVRKTAPSLPFPFTVYLYETKRSGSGMVVGEFTCQYADNTNNYSAYALMSTLTTKQLNDYGGTYKGTCIPKRLWFWYIAVAKRYEKPLPLSAFGLTRAPQSWCYVKKLEEEA